MRRSLVSAIDKFAKGAIAAIIPQITLSDKELIGATNPK